MLSQVRPDDRLLISYLHQAIHSGHKASLITMPDIEGGDAYGSAAQPIDFSRWEDRVDDSMTPFEQVSLNLATLCGAIPLENFLANDYDDTAEFDYRELNKKPAPNVTRDVLLLASHSSNRGSSTSGDDDMDVDEDPTAAPDPGREPNRADGDSRPVGEHSSLAVALSSGMTAVTSDSLITETPSFEALGKLHKACTRLSGTAEALNFEFIEENPFSIRCILTVTIPSAQGPCKRSYSTSPSFSKRSDAKGEAATIAVNMGALDFIKSASSPMALSKGKTELLARASDVHEAPTKAPDLGVISAGEEAIRYIDQLCEEWRPGGRVKADCFIYKERKNDNQIGCALRIALTPHAMRIYSTSPEYPSVEHAKGACALLALDEGVGEYIMKGNGQKSKPVTTDSRTRPQPVVVPPPLQLSLQDFFDTLPRPFMGKIDETGGATEIRWSNMFNMTLQGAKLNTLKSTFHFIYTDVKNGLTGCVLRISITDPPIVSAAEGETGAPQGRKELVKTYIVDPHFAKSNDAKTAACMVAITQDLRGYLAGISKAHENYTQSSRESDKKLSEHTLRMISKLRPGHKVAYDVFGSGGKGPESSKYFGCTLSVDVSPDEEKPDLRTFTPPSPLQSKADAKIAAVLEAAKRGVVELLRFGTPIPPEGYKTFWEAISKGEVYYLGGGDQASDNDSQERTKVTVKSKRKRKGKKKASKEIIVEATPSAGPEENEQQSGSESGEISEPVQEKARWRNAPSESQNTGSIPSAISAPRKAKRFKKQKSQRMDLGSGPMAYPPTRPPFSHPPEYSSSPGYHPPPPPPPSSYYPPHDQLIPPSHYSYPQGAHYPTPLPIYRSSYDPAPDPHYYPPPPPMHEPRGSESLWGRDFEIREGSGGRYRQWRGEPPVLKDEHPYSSSRYAGPANPTESYY